VIVVETVSLSAIVLKVIPEFYEMLTEDELDYQIVLRDGLAAVNKHDVWEIIHYSISMYQQQGALH
jgi:hypothetical protein